MSIESIILICSLLLLLFTIVQTSMVLGFCRWLAKTDESRLKLPLPHVAILLSVRGESNSLIDCLDALTRIDYPNFEIHIIVDNENDISFQTVNVWRTQCENHLITIHTLNEISQFASLKTSAVRQCIASLGTNVEAVAILDADTVVHKEWLTELTTPLRNEEFGLVTGNRWYDATRISLGNQIRFLYNAWAVPGMHFMKTAWGGSLAISRSVFTHPEFLSTFANTPTEETGAQTIRMKMGLKIAQRNSLLMAQRGDITVPSALGFITRQLIWTRLHYREWSGVFVGPLFIYMVTVCLACSACAAFAMENSLSFAIAALIFLAYWIVNWLLIAYLNQTVIKKMSTHQEQRFPDANWSHHMVIFLMIPVGFVVFVYALLKAQFSRKIRWSGIDYRIRSPHGIELVEYRPPQS